VLERAVGSAPVGPTLEEAVDAYLAAWNERDGAARAFLLDAAVADDFEFHGPTGTFRGRPALEGLIVALQERMGGAIVVRTGPVANGRFGWVVQTPAGDPLLGGTDQADAADDGRLRRISVAADLSSA
jgi:hypothetical protein